MAEPVRSRAELVDLLRERVKVLANRHADEVKVVSERVTLLGKIHADTRERFGRMIDLAQRVASGEVAKV